MANWRAPTETDLAAALSQREIDAFRASPAASLAEDPVAALLAQAAGETRGACRSNGRVRMGPEGTVPPSLMRAVVAIAAFDALKRLPVAVGEDRRRAKEDALALLEKVAEGRITPEGDGEPDDDSRPATSPLADDGPPRTLGGPLW
ncbi:MAG: DUF1320 family protein [Kiritimatiellae bacterium]|nr:DUF1320 family protein [Kiritimatiellia bacterium]